MFDGALVGMTADTDMGGLELGNKPTPRLENWRIALGLIARMT